MSTSTRLFSYSISSFKTWLLILAFVAGNLILPQLAHLVPHGGNALLPIYFFTLIVAYKYGIQGGLITALLSPVLNYLIFGMPVLAMLPVILTKSVLLATAAALTAGYFKKVSVILLIFVVLSYQIPGSLVEWMLTGSLSAAVQDFTTGLPGMAIQILGGYGILRLMTR